MRVLQLLKIQLNRLHLKILQKLPLLLKIHHLHNLLSTILLNIVLLHMVILQSLLTLALLKIQLNKHHIKFLQKLPLHLKIHHLHKLLSIILLSIVLLHMVILQSLLPLPLLKIQLNTLIIILLHMVILQSLLLTLPLIKIHQLNELLNIVLLHMFIL
jgi:hypothetical protein